MKKHDRQQQAHVVLMEPAAGHNQAYLDVRNPTECILEQDPSATWLTVSIQAQVMDELALSWCKQRRLVPISESLAHLTVKP